MRAGIATVITSTAIAGITLLAGASGASATPAQTCTWGGTPLAPTGQNRISQPGLTNTPSKSPLHFYATGPLGGQCQGTMVFDGVMDAGASCTAITFHAQVFGLPGVATVAGNAIGGIGPARLYDREGHVVGSENAQFLSDPNVVAECNSPQGVTRNPFSSLIELFGNHL